MRERGTPDRAVLDEILAAGFLCHLDGIVLARSVFELAATTLLALSLAEATVKVRLGPPDDGDSSDAREGRWAGVVPVRSVRGEPVPDPALSDTDQPVPDHVRAIAGRG